MCDNHSINDIIEYNRRTGLSRREFGALTLGAGLISALPAGGCDGGDDRVGSRDQDAGWHCGCLLRASRERARTRAC